MAGTIDTSNRARYDPLQRARDFRWSDQTRGGNVSLAQRLKAIQAGLGAVGQLAANLPPLQVGQVIALPDAEEQVIGKFFLQRNNDAIDTINIGLSGADGQPVIVPLNVLGPGSLDPLIGDFLEVADPAGVAVDGDGNIYVTSGIFLYRFGSDGELLDTFTPGSAGVIATFTANYGSTGTGTAPNFDAPDQAATDSAGNIYVADRLNNRLMKLNSSGAFVAQVTGLTNIFGVAVDGSGNVYVAYDTDTIRRYNASLALQWTVIYATSSLQHLAADGAFVYAVDGVNDRILKIVSSTGGVAAQWGNAGSGDDQFVAAYGVATDGEHVYVSDVTVNRVQKFTVNGEFVATWGTTGSGDGQLGIPRGVATHPTTGHVYVADTGNNRVCAFTANGSFLGKFGTIGSGNGQFTQPRGLAFSPDGTKLYVSDTTNDRITELAIVAPDSNLAGVALDSAGNILVADTIGNEVHVLNSTGTVIDTIGSGGTGNGQFDEPTDVALDSSDNVYVVDSGNHRVQKFTAGTYAYAAQEGGEGAGNGEFSTPVALAIDAGDRVAVVDRGNRRVQVFDDALAWQRSFGGYGNSNGQFDAPSGIAFDREGRTWVSDDGRDDVQAFDVNDDFLDKASGLGGPVALVFNVNNDLGYVAEQAAGKVSLLRLPLQNFPVLLTSMNHGDELEWDGATQHFVNRWGPKGLVLLDGPLDFSAVNAVQFDGYFVDEFPNYRVVVVLTAISNAAAQNLRMQMRAGGVTDTGATEYAYDRYGVSAGVANLQSDASEASTVWGVNGANATGLAATFDIFSPALASATRIAGVSTSIGGTPRASGHGGYHNQAAAYDGMNLFPDSGTITGSVWIYGYREFP